MQYAHDAAALRLLRLKAVAEADPGALVRILQFFQARNVVPQRVNARSMGAEFLEMEIDVDAAHLGAEAFRIIVTKLNELPIVVAAVACD